MLCCPAMSKSLLQYDSCIIHMFENCRCIRLTVMMTWVRHNLAIAEALRKINKVKTLPLHFGYCAPQTCAVTKRAVTPSVDNLNPVDIRGILDGGRPPPHHISSRLTILKSSGSCVSRLWSLRSRQIPILTLCLTIPYPIPSKHFRWDHIHAVSANRILWVYAGFWWYHGILLVHLQDSVGAFGAKWLTKWLHHAKAPPHRGVLLWEWGNKDVHLVTTFVFCHMSKCCFFQQEFHCENVSAKCRSLVQVTPIELDFEVIFM